MNCQSCGQSNRAAARFCESCGAKLPPLCPHCGTEVRSGARFCDMCGNSLAEPLSLPAIPDPRAYTPPHLAEKILRGRANLEGERRTVTILSVDAVGSTPMGERLDEEALYDIMQGCFARMMDAVHRYEGTVAQFLGDGFLALFGAPIAHEDSARRAVAAALDMQRAIGEYAAEIRQRHMVECRFRIGLNTGPVVVGKIGDDLSMDYTAIGDTANLAARMQQLAEPGAVYLSEYTFRAVQDYVECESLGSLAVKGKARSVAAFRALSMQGRLTRIEVAAARGLTPYVGRSHELRVLSSHFERVKHGQGQVVFVSGAAGIGKSRLLLEFRRALVEEAVTWLEGHTISFGKNIPYLPIVDILKHAFGVEEGDGDDAILNRLDTGTAGWESFAQATVPYLKYLLNVDPGDETVAVMDPSERRAGIFDGLRALLIENSRRQPLVVAIEDLHWMDEKSEEALAALVDTIATAPILLLVTYRPGYASSLGERTYYSRLHLDALRPEQSRLLLEALLQVSALPAQLQHLVTSKAEGNPFFIEEVTRALIELEALQVSGDTYTLARPLDRIRIPDTIQEVILSRIDRLEREAREALQLASVIGREFTVRLLRRISDLETTLDSSLGELKALELIYQKAYYPELAFMFKHALTHDVAYATLLIERRKALHRVVAAAVEELYADRLPEQYETLAYHFSQGEGWPKALDYLVKAGDKATAAYANQDALGFYTSALEICDRLGPTTLATSGVVMQKRGFANIILGNLPSAIADFEDMRHAAERLPDRHLEGLALALRGFAEIYQHAFEPAEVSLQAALAIGSEGFDDVRLAASLSLLGLFQVLNRHAEAVTLWPKVQEWATQSANPFWRGQAGFYLTLLPTWMGRFDEARDVVERWRSAAEASHQSLFSLGHQWVEAMACAGCGEYQRALTLLEQVLTTAERVGDHYVRTRAPNTIGWVYVELQHHERALEWNTRGVEVAKQMGAADPECEYNARLNLADTLMALVRLDEAEQQFCIVEQVVRAPRPQERWMLWRYAQHLFHSYGELWLMRGATEKALAYADECLLLAEGSESRKNIVKARRLRGQIFLAEGKLEAAEAELAAALQTASEVGNPPQLWKTLVALGDLRQAQGRLDAAQAAYRDALATIDRVADNLTDTSLRDTLLSSAHVERIRHLLRESERRGTSPAQVQ